MKIRIDEEYCIGCRLCQIHCIVEHSQSKDILKAFKSEPVRPLAKVLVEERKPVSFPIQCRHCNEPDCVYSCLTGAMFIDEKGIVRHNSEKCIGCWTCIMVCPIGAIARDERLRKVASKCDFCPGREVPACVANCPNEALTLEA